MQFEVPEAYKNRSSITRAEFADATGLSVAYFDQLAWKGEGPEFIKTSPRGRALYPVPRAFEQLTAYLAKTSPTA